MVLSIIILDRPNKEKEEKEEKEEIRLEGGFVCTLFFYFVVCDM